MNNFKFSEWKKRNDLLIKEMNLFEDEFRKSNNCSCSKIEYENGKTYCKHLINARTKKFKPEIENQMNSLL